MNFWTIVFIIYVFNTCACIVTCYSKGFSARRAITSKMPNYYDVTPRPSIIEKIFGHLSIFFQSALPIYHLLLLFGMLFMGDKVLTSFAENKLEEANFEDKGA